MKTKLELEDAFGDIVRKASRGNSVDVDRLSSSTGVSARRLEQFLAYKAQPSDDEARSIAATLHLDAAKLADSGAQRWYPSPLDPPPYLFHQINAPQPSNGYFLIFPDHGVCAVVDPAGSAASIIETLKRSKTELRYILLTHKHPDHTDALDAVRTAFPAARPVVHALDAAPLGALVDDAIGVEHGASLPFAGGEIGMLYTPGHTDGSCCFTYEGHVFTGDTLFAGSVGGLFGQRFGYPELLESVREKILTLPDASVVLPGHGPPSTVGQELAHNPFFTRD